MMFYFSICTIFLMKLYTTHATSMLAERNLGMFRRLKTYIETGFQKYQIVVMFQNRIKRDFTKLKREKNADFIEENE